MRLSRKYLQNPLLLVARQPITKLCRIYHIIKAHAFWFLGIQTHTDSNASATALARVLWPRLECRFLCKWVGKHLFLAIPIDCILRMSSISNGLPSMCNRLDKQYHFWAILYLYLFHANMETGLHQLNRRSIISIPQTASSQFFLPLFREQIAVSLKLPQLFIVHDSN